MDARKGIMESPNLTPRTASDIVYTYENFSQYNQDIKPTLRSPVLVWSGSMKTAYHYNEMRGYDTKSFHSRIRKAQLVPFTPWYQFFSSGEITSGYTDITFKNVDDSVRTRWYFSNSKGYPIGDQWILTPDVVGAYAPVSYKQYVTQAAASIYDQGWDALTFIAELTQVTSMFSSALRAISRAKIPRTWRQMSSTWLSYRYGWGPFIRDIKSISELIRSKNEDRLKRYVRTARGHISTENQWLAAYEGQDFYQERQYVDQIDIRPSGCVAADMIVPRIQVNPLQTGWELIPFSFVIDWFVNVGRVIGSLSVINAQGGYVAAMGYELSVKRTYSSNKTTNKPTYVSGNMYRYANASAVMTRRDPCTIPIIPRPSVRISATKILDLLALILQRIR